MNKRLLKVSKKYFNVTPHWAENFFLIIIQILKNILKNVENSIYANKNVLNFFFKVSKKLRIKSQKFTENYIEFSSFNTQFFY